MFFLSLKNSTPVNSIHRAVCSTDWLIDWFLDKVIINWTIDWLVDWLVIDWLIRWLIDWLIQGSSDWFDHVFKLWLAVDFLSVKLSWLIFVRIVDTPVSHYSISIILNFFQLVCLCRVVLCRRRAIHRYDERVIRVNWCRLSGIFLWWKKVSQTKSAWRTLFIQRFRMPLYFSNLRVFFVAFHACVCLALTPCDSWAIRGCSYATPV